MLSRMTRDEWLNQFCDELLKLRPHLSEKFVRTVALSRYGSEHPRVAARAYDQQQQPAAAPVAKKRSSSR
jgi:hypothetical protein